MIRAVSGEIVISVKDNSKSNQLADMSKATLTNKTSEGDLGQSTSNLKQESNAQESAVTSLPLPDPRVLWGRALLAIKKANKVMLHTVCINLGKVELRGNTLYVSVPSRLDYEMLKKPQNCGDLVESLKNLGYNVGIEFVLDETLRDSAESKIERLQKILGANIQGIN